VNITSGWYPDPDGKPCERYWDGVSWTDKTRPLTTSLPLGSEEQLPTVVNKGGGCGKVFLWILIIFVALFIFSCISILGDSSSSESKSTNPTTSSAENNSGSIDSPAQNLSEVESLSLEVDWQNYSPNVKTNLESLYLNRDCAGLQEQFDISESNNEAQRNRVGDGNSDLMMLTDAMMREVGCY